MRLSASEAEPVTTSSNDAPSTPAVESLAQATRGHLVRLLGELEAAKLQQLTDGGEAVFSVEHQGHHVQLILGVAEEDERIVLQSCVGMVGEEHQFKALTLLEALNLPAGGTVRLGMVMLRGGAMLQAVHGVVGAAAYEGFRAAVMKIVETTLAWRERIAGDATLGGMVRV